MPKKIKPRSDKNAKGEPLLRCPFPNCGAIFVKKPGEPETCLRHRTLISDVMFIMDHVSVADGAPEKEATGPKLFIPKPGMSNRAIEEAARAAKGGKKL